LERERIISFFNRLSIVLFKNETVRDRIHKYLEQVNEVLFTFIASKGLDSIINLVVVTCILLIFDVPYAFLLGLITGLFNFIPYLGSLVAVILISVITLITGGPGQAIKVVLPLLVFQQLDGNFIEPRIMKSSLKISPILVILAVVVGGAYFGIIGMFLAVPIAAIIKQVLIEYITLSET
jgi:predicted PurR-regulated permease PerM